MQRSFHIWIFVQIFSLTYILHWFDSGSRISIWKYHFKWLMENIPETCPNTSSNNFCSLWAKKNISISVPLLFLLKHVDSSLLKVGIWDLTRQRILSNVQRLKNLQNCPEIALFFPETVSVRTSRSSCITHLKSLQKSQVLNSCKTCRLTFILSKKK